MIYHTAAFELEKGDKVLLVGMPLTVAVVRPATTKMFVALNDVDGKRFKEMFVDDLFQFEVTHFAATETNTPEANYAAEYALGVTCEDDVLDFDSVGFNSNDGVFAVAEEWKEAA